MMDRNKGGGGGYLMSYTEMYESLIVIRRQGWLPLRVLCALWGLSGEVEARRVLREFVKASLVERKDRVSDGRVTAGVRLHDLQLDYVQQRCGRGGEKKWHEKIVQEWEWKEDEYTQGVAWICGRKWKSDVAGDEYFRDNLCRHLKGAHLKDELCEVLSDPRWAAERLTRAEGMGLQEDFKIFTGVDGEGGKGCEAGDTIWSLQKIAREARLSASYVVHSSREVWFQLYDRLLIFRNKSKLIRDYLCTIEKVAERPWLKSLKPRLRAPDAAQDIFAHQGKIAGMSGCAEKNEVTAWGKNGDHLFRRTFRNGEVKNSVTCEVLEDMRVVWSQNGKYVAAGSFNDVQVWDMRTRTTAQRFGREFSLGNGDYDSYDDKGWNLSGDGKQLAFGGEYGNQLSFEDGYGNGHGKIMLWDAETGRKIKEVTSRWNDNIGKVSFSPDGKRILSAGMSGSYLMMCGETGERISEYNLPEIDIDVGNISVGWSRNGKRVACETYDWNERLAGRLLIFDGETGENLWYEETSRHKGGVCLSWSEDEKQLWCFRTDSQCYEHGELCVWDGGSGKIIKKIEVSCCPFFSEEEENIFQKLSLTGDERWLAVSDGISVAVWDAEMGAEIWFDKNLLQGRVEALGWLQDGKRMFSADQHGKIVIWGWENLEGVREEKARGADRDITTWKWSSDDKLITAVGQGGDICMYDVKTGKVVWKDVETHVSKVGCLEISGDNKRVFSVARDGKVATWNMSTGEKIWEAQKNEDGRRETCWSNDGTKILAGMYSTLTLQTSLTLWDGKTGDKLWERVTDSCIMHMAWCGDDTKIACGDQSGKVVLRSSGTGEMVRDAVRHHTGNVELVKWSPDGKWIASASTTCRLPSSGEVLIWNLETGATMKSIEEDSYTFCLEWSDDGRLLAYGFRDRLVIWNCETGQKMEEQESRRNDTFRDIAWSQDELRVASLSTSNELRISAVTSQGIVCVKQYYDAACFNKSSMRQMIDTKVGELSAELERKLKIRRTGKDRTFYGDGVYYIAGDEDIRLATVADQEWYCSTSGRHIAIADGMESGLFFFELVE